VRPIARSIALRYTVAVGCVALAVLVHRVLEPFGGARAPVVMLTLAVFGASIYGGAGPGLLATALSVLVTLSSPPWSFSLADPAQRLRLVLFAVIGACTAFLGEARLRSERRLADALEREREARKEAERLARVKDDFISTVSHELRTPLNAILGWAHLLRAHASPETLRGLDVIARNANAEARIVGDLLDASRAWSGKLQVHPVTCDIAEIARDTVDALGPTARKREVEIGLARPDGDVLVEGDAERLAQVIRNLIDNAIKFSAPESRIDVRLAREGDRIELAVLDRGEGMDPEVVERLFDKFQQADSSTTRRHAGLGLGLYLSKAIVTAHGGTIGASSEGRGKGSRFWLTLPRSSRSLDQAPGPAVGPPEVAPVRVLVVDDDPDSGEVVRRILVDHGATVDLELGADAALARWIEGHHPVVISDLSMPGRDGFWLAHEIGVRAEGPRPRLIALTALVRPEDRERARAEGFELFLSKPLDPQALLQAIAR